MGLLRDTNEALAELGDQRFRGIGEIAGNKKPDAVAGFLFVILNTQEGQDRD